MGLWRKELWPRTFAVALTQRQGALLYRRHYIIIVREKDDETPRYGNDGNMTAMDAERYLNELPLGDKGKPGSLRHLAYVAGGNVYDAVKSAVKDKVVASLSEYYCTPGRFDEIWDSLTKAERKIVSFHIWSDECEPSDYADDIASEFGLKEIEDRNSYWYAHNGLNLFKRKLAKRNSKLWLLFPKNADNLFFYRELLSAVGEMKREYSVVPSDVPLATREHRASDFANIVRFCNACVPGGARRSRCLICRMSSL